MNQSIKACGVLLAALWFWCWGSVVSLFALFSNADIGLVVLISLLIWVIGVIVGWWVLFYLSDRLIKWISADKKKKRAA